MTPDDRARFEKILGMLGSKFSGERAAAAAKAHDFLRVRNLSWAEVLREADAEPVPQSKPWPQAFSEAMERGRRASPEDKAARKEAWRRARYGADEDGFETGRK